MWRWNQKQVREHFECQFLHYEPRSFTVSLFNSACTELECGQLSSSSESEDSSEETEEGANCSLDANELQSLEDAEAENDVDDETMSGNYSQKHDFFLRQIVFLQISNKLCETRFRRETNNNVFIISR